jgi:hypothetical protein
MQPIEAVRVFVTGAALPFDYHGFGAGRRRQQPAKGRYSGKQTEQPGGRG